MEYVDHLHEHFVDPVRDRARPLPAAAGAGLQREMLAPSRAEFAFPDGPAWARERG